MLVGNRHPLNSLLKWQVTFEVVSDTSSGDLWVLIFTWSLIPLWPQWGNGKYWWIFCFYHQFSWEIKIEHLNILAFKYSLNMHFHFFGAHSYRKGILQKISHKNSKITNCPIVSYETEKPPACLCGAVSHPDLDLSSGHDLRGLRSSPSRARRWLWSLLRILSSPLPLSLPLLKQPTTNQPTKQTETWEATMETQLDYSLHRLWHGHLAGFPPLFLGHNL